MTTIAATFRLVKMYYREAWTAYVIAIGVTIIMTLIGSTGFMEGKSGTIVLMHYFEPLMAYFLLALTFVNYYSIYLFINKNKYLPHISIPAPLASKVISVVITQLLIPVIATVSVVLSLLLGLIYYHPESWTWFEKSVEMDAKANVIKGFSFLLAFYTLPLACAIIFKHKWKIALTLFCAFLFFFIAIESPAWFSGDLSGLISWIVFAGEVIGTIYLYERKDV